MTKLNPLSRAVATATVAAGACLFASACPPALAAGKAKAAAVKGAAAGTGENTPLNLAPASTGSHSSGSGASIVRTIVGLAIVIAVIWGLSWILRQFKSGREPRSSGGDGLRSLASLTLSTGRAVHLVRAGSDFLLLGSAEQGVVPIHRYTEQEAREAGLMDVVEADAATGKRRPLLRPPTDSSMRPDPASPRHHHIGHGGHDPMRMPAPGPGTSLVDRLRELTVRR